MRISEKENGIFQKEVRTVSGRCTCLRQNAAKPPAISRVRSSEEHLDRRTLYLGTRTFVEKRRRGSCCGRPVEVQQGHAQPVIAGICLLRSAVNMLVLAQHVAATPAYLQRSRVIPFVCRVSGDLTRSVWHGLASTAIRWPAMQTLIKQSPPLPCPSCLKSHENNI